MTSGVTLAIDQGTSGTKAIVLSPNGDVLASAYRPIRPSYGSGGRVEIDADEVLRSVVDAGREAVADAQVPIDAVGLANQGETVLAWDAASGAALTPAMVWQDRRAADVCRRLSDAAPTLRALTGLPLDEYFAAPKMAWLREHSTRDGVVTMIDSWLLRRLTGEFVTDASTASRSLLTDLDIGQWSSEAMAIFGLAAEPMPRILDCASTFGVTAAFGPEMPVTAAAADQQAALYGQGCFVPGSAKCTYGTGAFLLANAGALPRRSANDLAACVAWSLGGKRTYCLDGQVFTVGSAVRWLTDIGVIGGAHELDACAASVTSDGGVQFVPALAGLAAPWWSGSSRGAVHGLSLETERGHLVRAFLEGIAAQITMLAAAMQSDLGQALPELRVDGGLTQSATLMQLQADLLQVPVRVFHSPDATPLGIGALARLGLSASAATDERAPAARYEPRMSATEAAERMARFTGLVAKLLDDQQVTAERV